MTEELLQRYLSGVSTPDENKEILVWIEANSRNRNDLNLLRKIYSAIICNSRGLASESSRADIPAARTDSKPTTDDSAQSPIASILGHIDLKSI